MTSLQNCDHIKQLCQWRTTCIRRLNWSLFFICLLMKRVGRFLHSAGITWAAVLKLCRGICGTLFIMCDVIQKNCCMQYIFYNLQYFSVCCLFEKMMKRKGKRGFSSNVMQTFPTIYIYYIDLFTVTHLNSYFVYFCWPKIMRHISFGFHCISMHMYTCIQIPMSLTHFWQYI